MSVLGNGSSNIYDHIGARMPTPATLLQKLQLKRLVKAGE
jgi:hypothetical protein